MTLNNASLDATQTGTGCPHESPEKNVETAPNKTYKLTSMPQQYRQIKKHLCFVSSAATVGSEGAAPVDSCPAKIEWFHEYDVLKFMVPLFSPQFHVPASGTPAASFFTVCQSQEKHQEKHDVVELPTVQNKHKNQQ